MFHFIQCLAVCQWTASSRGYRLHDSSDWQFGGRMWVQVHEAHSRSVLSSPPKSHWPNAVAAQDSPRSNTHAYLLPPPPAFVQSLIKGSTPHTAQTLEPPCNTQSDIHPQNESPQQQQKRLLVGPPADAHTLGTTKTRGGGGKSTPDDIAADSSPRAEAQVKRLSAQLAKQQMAAQRLQLECAAHLERLTQRHHVQVSVSLACCSQGQSFILSY